MEALLPELLGHICRYLPRQAIVSLFKTSVVLHDKVDHTMVRDALLAQHPYLRPHLGEGKNRTIDVLHCWWWWEAVVDLEAQHILTHTPSERTTHHDVWTTDGPRYATADKTSVSIYTVRDGERHMIGSFPIYVAAYCGLTIRALWFTPKSLCISVEKGPILEAPLTRHPDSANEPPLKRSRSGEFQLDQLGR